MTKTTDKTVDLFYKTTHVRNGQGTLGPFTVALCHCANGETVKLTGNSYIIGELFSREPNDNELKSSLTKIILLDTNVNFDNEPMMVSLIHYLKIPENQLFYAQKHPSFFARKVGKLSNSKKNWAVNSKPFLHNCFVNGKEIKFGSKYLIGRFCSSSEIVDYMSGDNAYGQANKLARDLMEHYKYNFIVESDEGKTNEDLVLHTKHIPHVFPQEIAMIMKSGKYTAIPYPKFKPNFIQTIVHKWNVLSRSVRYKKHNAVISLRNKKQKFDLIKKYRKNKDWNYFWSTLIDEMGLMDFVEKFISDKNNFQLISKIPASSLQSYLIGLYYHHQEMESFFKRY